MILIKQAIYTFACFYYLVVPAVVLLNALLCTYDMETRSSILVTGGAGFIGSHTIVELLNSGYSVVVVDNLVNAYAANEKQKPESIKRVEIITGKTVPFFNIDVRDKKALNNLFQQFKIDCVIHFAALKAVGESVQIPLQYYQNNIAGSSTLFQVMQENNVKRLVFSSSATVYGTPQFLPITEDHPTGQGCTNPYGKSKYFVEEILKDVCTSDPEWHVILLRYFNPVGAHESGLIGEDPSGIPNNLLPYIAQVAVGKREKVNVFGADYDTPDGTGVRDYIHITDLAIGHLKALLKLNDTNFRGCEVYNLGTGHGYSVLEMIKAFSKASQKEIKYEICKRREGDVASSFADATKARKELDWIATRDINDMCFDAWRWQSANPSGYDQNPSIAC